MGDAPRPIGQPEPAEAAGLAYAQHAALAEHLARMAAEPRVLTTEDRRILRLACAALRVLAVRLDAAEHELSTYAGWRGKA